MRNLFLPKIFVFIYRPETFQHVPTWLNDAKNSARSECSICVVGNKKDLKDSRVIKYNDGAKFCQENSKKIHRIIINSYKTLKSFITSL